jgi:hypothetical protein
MPTETNGRAKCLTNFGMTALGIVLAMTPLALWVVPTENAFIAVLAIAVMAGLFIIVLAGCEGSDLDQQSEPPRAKSMETLTDQFVEGVHRLFPLTYHNRRVGDSAFQRKMDRLKRLLDS